MTPERVSWSAQVNVAVTSDLNQPLPFASADRLPVTVGLDLSTFTVVSSVAELPAVSVAVPRTFCAEPSPLVTGAVQLAMPEPLSVQVKVTVTSLLFQLRTLAAGDCSWLMPGAVLSTVTARLLQSETFDTVVVGAVRSIFTGALAADVSLPARSRTEVPAVR